MSDILNSIPQNVIDKLSYLPIESGCYIMKDKNGNVLYVGKAKVLKNRVRQYFHKSTDMTRRIRRMVSLVADFEYVVTTNELEALVLESSLIKRYAPPFNVLLRDDKSYPYICITLKDEYPRVKSVRKLRFTPNDKNKYFGPYTDVNAVRETIKLIRQIFKIPCGYKEPSRSGGKACLYYHINQCLGVCCNKASIDDYMKSVNDVISFLDGNRKGLVNDLTDRMMSYSDNLEFERAAKIRDQINAIERLVNKQQIVSENYDDKDVISLAYDNYSACVFVMNVKNGYVVGQNQIVIDNIDEDNISSSMYEFIINFYSLSCHIPKEILVNIEPDDKDELEVWLSNYAGNDTKSDRKKVVINTPQRGEKKKLLDLASTNAKEQVAYLTKKSSDDTLKISAQLIELQTAINSEVYPYRIEAYDISNIQGTNTVASLVTFVGGKPATNLYRRFKINQTEGKPDDFASMKEVISRRFSGSLTKSADFETYPDLVVIDGGMGQLSSAVKILNELNVYVPIISLAKREELIYLPDNNVPIALAKRSEALKMLQRLRDEAHRFAITYHKTLRSKKMKTSVLNDIDGVGAKRRVNLIKHFKDVENIKSATVEELLKVEGINKPVAEKIFNYFNK